MERGGDRDDREEGTKRVLEVKEDLVGALAELVGEDGLLKGLDGEDEDEEDDDHADNGEGGGNGDDLALGWTGGGG